MKKTIIIKGKEGTGKSFLSRQLSYLFEKPVFITCRDLKSKYEKHLFENVNKETDLIVLDEVDKDLVKHLVYSTYERVYVDKRGVHSFWIESPRVIIISDEFDQQSLSESFKRRTKVLETTIDYIDNQRIFQIKKLS